MAFPTGQHLRVEQTFHMSSINAYSRNIFYYTLAGPAPDIAEMPSVAQFFNDEYATAFAGVLPVGVNVSQTTAVWKFGSTQYDAVSTGVAIAGTVVGEILPEEDCVVLQKRTGVEGRNKRGRWFFSFVPEASQTAGELTAGAITDWKEICQHLRQPREQQQAGRTWSPVLADSKTGTWQPILDVRVVNQICNKRSRRNPKRLVVSAAAF